MQAGQWVAPGEVIATIETTKSTCDLVVETGGYIAGLLAQPAGQNDPLTAIRFAVWQHGAAADAATKCRSNWTVEDLVSHLGSVRSGD